MGISIRKLKHLIRFKADELVALVAKVELQLKNAPLGTLRPVKNHGRWQYYCVSGSSGKNGRYIPQEKLSLTRELAQRDYNKKLLKRLKSVLNIFEDAYAKIDENAVQAVFDGLSESRRRLVTPIFLSDEVFVEQWLKVEYVHMGFNEEAPELYTANGERVRSKSEVMIADTLKRLGIPYRYEFPVKLNGFTVHPDFYCLDVKNRQEFVWEHLGMMGDKDYAEHAIEKLNRYRRAGFFEGKNMIVTMETEGKPLSSKMIEEACRNYLI